MYILLGLLSVMILMTFGLSRRMSGHTQLLTLADQTRVARFFLESYVGDVVRQIRLKANSADSPIFPVFRGKGPGAISAGQEAEVPLDYSPDPKGLLAEIMDAYEIDLIGRPRITLGNLKALGYPDCLSLPPTLNGLEKRGFISITCSIRFMLREYTLFAQYPFVTTMNLTPVLREFILFFDQLHLEQRRPFGREDKVNIVFTKDSQHPRDVPAEFSAYSGQPWILWPTPGHEDDRDRCGRVFLGGDNKPIFLNLAGEKNFQSIAGAPPNEQVEGYMSDMWQVWPSWFNVNDKKEEFKCNPLFLDADFKWIKMRSLEVPLKYPNHRAKMGIFGFSHEIYDPVGGVFAQSERKLDDILKRDPAFQTLVAENRKALALAGSLKLFGMNAEPDLRKTYYGPAREVFGQVFGRFFLVTIFDYPSPRGGGAILPYQADPYFQPSPFPSYSNVNMIPFEPANPGLRYSDFMSRVVSGGKDFDPRNAANYFPMNPQSKVSGRPYDFHDFKPADGLMLSKGFEQFGNQWFDLDRKKRCDDQALKSVQARISRCFRNQAEFKEFVGLNKGKFWVNGVVYIEGSLELGNIETDDIGGGVVLVEKDISLGNITRGLDFSKEVPIEDVITCVSGLKQDRFLTFVSLSGRPITLVGTKHIGVQVISLKANSTFPADQITWTGMDKILFSGGVAVDTPNLEQRVREFARSGADPIFLYVPSMADPEPTCSVQILPNMHEYRLSAKGVPRS
jgi:hypothetical protein